MPGKANKSYFLKRPIDFLSALCLLLALTPILAGISLIILIKEGRPIFFRQTRIGKELRRFRMLKYRTMTVAVDNGDVPEDVPLDVVKAQRLGFRTTEVNDSRVTPVGAFLRSTSLDELPQLWNVLTGDMSLIGPRPMTPVQRADFAVHEWQVRHAVRPGITGLAQVRGRSALTQEELVDYDKEYVQSCTLRQDIRIALLTLRIVLKRSGTN
ncbi:sugar transferase [Achromobacter spanius]|uniref:sugar transferase n=1 Tax=Achromobacter spanius TaxID=217203 RepID=UPI0022266868|nr:sugar transferase [Achromobacter spanius]